MKSLSILLPFLLSIVSIANADTLRVCSDPNNLPFSNQAREGFENELAQWIADELGMRLEYTWWAQRRGHLRNTIHDDRCDLIMGIPSSTEWLLTTRPYYRSSYMFVTREDSDIEIESFDDPVLESLRIGVHLIGDDYNNTPPAHALSRRGLGSNLVGFMIYGNYSEPNPPARLIEAVANGDIDVAVAWGPLAGYFAQRQEVPLKLTEVRPIIDKYGLPFVFPISMGMALDRRELKSRLDQLLHENRDVVQSLLAEYGIPEQGRQARQERN